MIHFNVKNSKSRLVNLKCVTYAQPIPLSLSPSEFLLLGHVYIDAKELHYTSAKVIPLESLLSKRKQSP